MATLTEPTLNRLILEARILLNQQDSSNSNWSDQELTIYANDAIRQYFCVVNENAEGQFDVVADLDITANQETVDLPADCFEVRTVYKKVTQGYAVLPYLNYVNRSYDTQGGTSSTMYDASYYFRGNSLVLRPTPNFSEVGGLRIEYTAFPETLIWGGDVMSSVSPIFKELIVLYIVYKAKCKESLVTGTDTTSAVAGMLKDAYNNFVNTVGNRSKYPTFVQPFTP